MATVLQIARTSEQHRLKAILNPIEAGYVRFAYAFPVALLLGSAWAIGPGEIPTPGVRFWLTAGVASITQILATVALLKSFRIRNFATGTLYAKTEVLFVGVASTVFLDEALKPLAWVGGAICLCGMAALHLDRNRSSLRLDSAALFGSLAGLGFALASVSLRAASSSLEGTTFDRAALTLTTMLGIQTLTQGAYIGFSSQASILKTAQAWRQAIGVAVLSLAGSTAWVVAMTLENAAKVRTLGQVEIIFAFAFGVFVHREKHRLAEYLASAVAVAGIVLYAAA